MHNPNPFDFVPFSNEPFLRALATFDTMGDKLSGYLEVKMKALTPVHIVGAQTRGRGESHSHMYRQDGSYYIPASTLRGMLRAFIEALTSGWVSQANLLYPKAYNNRHVEFSTFENAIDPAFQAKKQEGQTIDLASYLFGTVVEPDASEEKSEALAIKGKVFVEDALVRKNSVVDNEYWLPDIDDKAFMGGAKPSASNWWYLQPAKIWKRTTRGRDVAEFVGGKFWGRKFYFHQDPQKCTRYYDGKRGEWRYSGKRHFHRVWLECMAKEQTTDTFRIYLDRVPNRFVVFLAHMLMPGPTIRHKLGYGKAYGYGSVEFEIVTMQLRNDSQASRLPARLQTWPLAKDLGWGDLASIGFRDLIDWTALHHLSQILAWQDNSNLVFTYPPFAPGYFAQPIQYAELRANAPKGITIRDSMTVSPREARSIAVALFELKKPIHFRYYQEQARGWDIIAKRSIKKG
ncbi:MAG: hypothetical protein GY759_03525 [Chloroflexi bacterium]|nr:hypothetical protein [Chloroflexota bacterium]